jgi:hypothetical protein
MNTATIKSIVRDANTAHGFRAFEAVELNGAWLHLVDGATSAFYRVADIAEAGEDALREALAPNNADAYSLWCGRVQAHHLADLPAHAQRIARRIGLDSANW